jgi:6,7-dimethyl-8-ribityllumazine synthase
LYPSAQRDLLIRMARHGLVQAKWTQKILDEMLPPASAETRALSLGS